MQINLPQQINRGIHVRGNGKSIDIIVQALELSGQHFTAELEIKENGTSKTIRVTPWESYRQFNEDKNLKVGITRPNGKRDVTLCCIYSSDYNVTGPRDYGNDH